MNLHVTYGPDDDTTHEWTAQTDRDPAIVAEFIDDLMRDVDAERLCRTTADRTTLVDTTPVVETVK